MNYAVIKIQGKQHRIQSGDTLIVDRLDVKEGDIINLDEVLLFVDGNKVEVGTPHLEGKNLTAKVIEHLRGEKIRVAVYKSKSRYRKVRGHRQEQTKLEIATFGSKPATKKAEPKPATKKAEPKKEAKKTDKLTTKNPPAKKE